MSMAAFQDVGRDLGVVHVGFRVEAAHGRGLGMSHASSPQLNHEIIIHNMKTHYHPSTPAGLRRTLGVLTTLLCCAAGPLLGATSIIYSNNFETYTSVATDLSDT